MSNDFFHSNDHKQWLRSLVWRADIDMCVSVLHSGIGRAEMKKC